MKIKDITDALEAVAPLSYQEEYDNCGLITGQKETEITQVLLTLDCTEDVIEEAIRLNCQLVVAHHPILFSGLKKLNGNTYVERTLLKAIRNGIAIYACHTNLDNVKGGVNTKICEKLGMTGLSILAPKPGLLKKLVTFVPPSHHAALLEALFKAGAGHIGHYDACSFSTEGSGTFRGLEGSSPFVGAPHQLSTEKELRVETIFAIPDETKVVAALLGAHPYEEVAYDIYPLSNVHPQVGSGMKGELEVAMEETDFLNHVKKTFGAGSLRHTRLLGKPVKKVAVCGGSGRFLLNDAIRSGADAYITSDFKYHEFFDAEDKILLIDTGHFESERFTPEIFYDIIQKKFATFAIHLSKVNTNPVNYF